MRKTRKTAAVVALYTFLMLGSVSVVRADQPVTREQISSEQTETKTDSSAQTTESKATTETTTQTTQAKPTTEATTHTHTAATTHTTAAATHTKKHTAATHTKKQKTKSDQDKKKDKKNKKKDKKSIIPKVYNDHSLEMKDKKETIQGFIYFNQADEAWNHSGLSIHSAGCGPSAIAVCITNLTSKWVTPVDVASWGSQNGYYSSAGSVHEGIPAMVEHFGLQCEGAGTDYEKIKAALKNGNFVIGLMGPGYFTNGGHFIALVEIDQDDQVTVADVGSRRRSQFKYALKDVIGESKAAGKPVPAECILPEQL